MKKRKKPEKQKKIQLPDPEPSNHTSETDHEWLEENVRGVLPADRDLKRNIGCG